MGRGAPGRGHDHVTNPAGVQSGAAGYHAGDLTGLRLIGREAGCLPTPAPPALR